MGVTSVLWRNTQQNPRSTWPVRPALIGKRQAVLRVYAETGRFLQQQAWSGDWRVVVICPHRDLHFGDPTPVQEFLERRVLWVELQPRDGQLPAACAGRQSPTRRLPRCCR